MRVKAVEILIERNSKFTNVYRLAQSQMRQQKLEYAVQEAQKPLARHLDDADLDRMLREQEREGDPMAAMLRRKKERSTTTKGCDANMVAFLEKRFSKPLIFCRETKI